MAFHRSFHRRSFHRRTFLAQRGRHKSEQICIVTSPKSKRIKCIAISDVCHLYLTQLDKAFALWTNKLVEGHLMCSKRAIHKALACFVCVLVIAWFNVFNGRHRT